MANEMNNLAGFFTRRNFLKITGGCAALSSTSMLSTILDLQMTKAALAALPPFADYKALVCVFLSGGIDTHNVLMPYEDQEFTDYSAARTNLAIPKASMLQINTPSGRRFGLHPRLTELRDLYNAGRLATVANVGSLVVPIANKNVLASSAKPLGLYSHSDLIKHWQTSVPQSRTQITGWAGRMADMITDPSISTTNAAISMNISLSGLNVFETGRVATPYAISSNATSPAVVLSGYSNTTTNARDRIFSRFSDSALGETYSDLLERSYAEARRASIDAAITFNSAIANTLTTVFPSTSLGNQLKMVARIIGARQTLGRSRQIFFINAGGWDHHADLLTNQNNMLPTVSQAFKAFYDATVELGVANRVTTFTTSDFSRTLTSNGTGSDHGWGGNHFVFGGAVVGGNVFGSYPASLAPNNILDTGRGRIIPTVSVDQYAAELAMWFGIPNDSNLVDVFPNIRNFFSASAVGRPLGFTT